MQLVFACPRCERSNLLADVVPQQPLHCAHCDWQRPSEAAADEAPANCLVCGCGDLWRQKDFPAKVGLTMVAAGVVFSTIAWSYYRPLLAIGILMGFALLDLVLFLIMPDVLVCYRCGARHRQLPLDDSVPRFNLETAERYRQETARLRESTNSATNNS